MSADWSKWSLIDAYGVEDASDGVVVTARYYGQVSDVASRPVRGDLGPAGSVAAALKVSQVSLTPISQFQYLVDVRFKANVGPGIKSKYTSTEAKAQKGFDYKVGSFTVTPEMLGLRPTTKADKVHVASMKEWTPGAQESTGVQMTETDWLNPSYVPPACPFTVRPNIQYINQVLPTLVAVCWYNRPIGDITTTPLLIVGVSGASSIPSDFAIEDRTTAGMWRVIGQEMSEYTTSDGLQYKTIRRTLEHVPNIEDVGGTNKVKWDSAKLGGTITWGTMT